MGILEGLLINPRKKKKAAKKAHKKAAPKKHRKSAKRVAAGKKAARTRAHKHAAKVAAGKKAARKRVHKHVRKNAYKHVRKNAYKHAKRHGLHGVVAIGVKHRGKERAVKLLRPKKWYALETKRYGSKKLSKRSKIMPKGRKSIYSTLVNGPKDMAIQAFSTIKSEALPIAGGAVLGFGSPAILRLLLSGVAKVPTVGIKIQDTINNKWVFPWARLGLVAGLGILIKNAKQPIADKAVKYALILNAALLARSYIQNLLPSQYTGFLSGAEDVELMNPELTQETGFELEGIRQEGVQGIHGLQQEGLTGLLPEGTGISGLENVGELGLGEDETPEFVEDESGIL